MVGRFVGRLVLVVVVSGLVAILVSGCAGVQSRGPTTTEIAVELASEVVSGIPDGSTVLILGFYESDGGSVHPANDALTSDLTIEFLDAPGREIKVINRDMLSQALEELKFSLSELSDAEKAQRIGGFLAADVLVRGVVSSDFVSVEATDVETLTLLAVGKYTASERMVFASEKGAGSAEAPGRDRAAASGRGGAAAKGAVTILGAFSEEDAEHFRAAMAPFEERTGIDIRYEVSADFGRDIEERIEAGRPPDIAGFPQPGLLYDMVDRGAVYDLAGWFEPGYLEEQYADAWLEMARYGGITAGLWYRANIKSLVWYPHPEFERAGYEVPETWDELLLLTERIAADGRTPWSIGIESGSATGWVATDWMEDIMLRTVPAEEYDAWIAGELPFDSEPVRRAADIMAEIWFTDGYVLGGKESILNVPFADGVAPLEADPPQAWLHRQANFITSFFADRSRLGEDLRYFYLPPIDAEEGRPVLTAGDIFAALTDRPETEEVMRYLSTGRSTRAWVETGTMISPHNDAELGWYPDAESRGLAEILAEADTIRFDASDMMPPEVGAGAFWSGMSEWVRGEDLDAVLSEIDAAWPR